MRSDNALEPPRERSADRYTKTAIAANAASKSSAALALGDENHDGRIEVTELAGYLKANLPNLSEKNGVRRQIPQVKVTGSDFTLLNRIKTSAIDDIRRQGLQQ